MKDNKIILNAQISSDELENHVEKAIDKYIENICDEKIKKYMTLNLDKRLKKFCENTYWNRISYGGKSQRIEDIIDSKIGSIADYFIEEKVGEKIENAIDELLTKKLLEKISK